jgi:hypothetical protein
MRSISARSLAVAALVLVSAGCSTNQGKIEGTKWSSQAGIVKGVNLPSGTMSLSFAKDGSLIFKAGPQTYTGKYSLGLGSYVTLNLDRELAGRKVHVEQVSINGNQLTMTDSDGTTLDFNKAP